MIEPTSSETWQEPSEGGVAGLIPVRPHLFLLLEADRPLAGGARYALHDIDEVRIGRGAERSVTRQVADGRRALDVRVPGRWMSSSHARLVREATAPGGWALEDLGSKNGTLVGGERITRALLADGDVVELGHTLFAFSLALPTPPGAAADGDVDSATFGERPAGLRTLHPALAARAEALEQIARSGVPVLLLGESGTGKELLARAVHDRSERRGAFVAVNCGGLSAALVESLLFGHVKGAFSGASRDEPGLVRASDGGTLFLDEIGDLPAAAQATMLRVLQEREVMPVGSTRAAPVDLRVVCATHRPLDSLVASGEFRSDLLARIEGFRHLLAPLRERRGDLGLLVATLLPRLAGARASSVVFAMDAARALADHPWPGNVRELEQALARALAQSSDGRIEAAQLALPAHTPPPAARAEPLTPGDAELRARLVFELAQHGGNVTEVAKAMGKARMQIQRWMARLELDPKTFRRAR